MKRTLQIFFALMSVGMIALVYHTQMQSDLFHLPEPVLKEPWFWTTLVDFYNNIAILACWVVYKEANWLKSSVWILAFIVLGSIATALYVFIQLTRLKKDQGWDALLVRRT